MNLTSELKANITLLALLQESMRSTLGLWSGLYLGVPWNVTWHGKSFLNFGLGCSVQVQSLGPNLHEASAGYLVGAEPDG